jgi:predicted MFS family arabinose efflux permease
MALTLYEPAFSVLTSLYEVDYKRAVTTVTLAGGFASTVFWPLTESLVGWIGWRQALIFYAGLHLAVCLPAHFFGLRRAGGAQTPVVTSTDPAMTVSDLIRQPRFLLLALSYTFNAIVFSIVSVHLIPLLQTKGISPQQAAWLAAAAGPMQVAGRVVEFRFGNRWPAALTGKVALLMLIPALAGLAIPSAPIVLLLASIGLYGVSNGVMTIVRGVSIVELFGRQSFAQVSGALAAPSTLARAAGPILASLLLVQSTGYGGVLAAMIALASISVVLFARASGPTKHQID